MKKLTAILLLFLFPGSILAQTKCACVALQLPGLGADFFGLTYLSTIHVPTVPFKILRLWNSSNPNAAGWNASSNSCGTPDFTTVNTWLTQANTNGQDVMWTAGRTPSCAITGGAGSCTGDFAPNGCAQPPSDIGTTDAQWKAFVTALVTNSLAQATHIKYYECVNEFDLAGEWTDTIAHLVTFCGDMAAIVHSMDASAVVWGPSASTGNKFGVHGYPAYITAGGDATYDVMNLHAYLFGCSSHDCGNPEGIGGTSGGIADYIAQAKLLTSKPIGFSEGNWGCGTANTISDALKQAYVYQEYVIMWSLGVQRYVWYEWDNNGQPLGGAGTCGTLAPSDVAGPAATAYQSTQASLVGAQTQVGINPCSTVGTTVTCTYLLSGAAAEILYDTTNTPTVTVPSNFTIQFNADGTNQAIVSHQVTLGKIPIRIG